MANPHFQQILAHRPCGLLTDIDGTISPIAPTPDAARVTLAAQTQLRRLAQHIELVAAISGRAAADAARMVGLPELTYVGNHGLEVWHDNISEPLPEAQPYAAVIAEVLDLAQAQVLLRGVLFENKGVTASVHYRQADDPAAAQEQLGIVLEKLAATHGLRLTQGRMVWELRPPLDVNKGTAVRWLIEQHGLRSVIFVGDDRTDADAFAALRMLREQQHCHTLNIGVVGPDTPTIVRELADVLVEGVAGVEQALAELAGLAAQNNA